MSNTLRKLEMSKRVAESMGCSRSRGEQALNAVLASIVDAMRAGDRVVLTSFGTFEVREIKARMVRPIRGANSGELIEVPAHNSVRFRAGESLAQVAKDRQSG